MNEYFFHWKQFIMSPPSPSSSPSVFFKSARRRIRVQNAASAKFSFKEIEALSYCNKTKCFNNMYFVCPKCDPCNARTDSLAVSYINGHRLQGEPARSNCQYWIRKCSESGERVLAWTSSTQIASAPPITSFMSWLLPFMKEFSGVEHVCLWSFVFPWQPINFWQLCLA